MIAAGLPQRVFPVIRNLKHCFINLWSFRVQQWLYRLFDLVLLFAVSTAALAIAIRCVWSLRQCLFVTAAFREKQIPLFEQGDWQGVFDYCEEHPALAERIICAVLLIALGLMKFLKTEQAL